MAATIYTIGYAGRLLPDFLDALKEAGVDRVVDVRALPLSRRKGFSKTSLGQALTAAGIEYIHLRSAGNPYRDQKNEIERCLALYAGHLDENPHVVDEVETAITGHRAALLCFEAEACECHRSVLVARLLQKKPSSRVMHL
ncbi:DUF488 domain-containing protein [Sorangium sp. So ce834]|uniref:DUF488 domain-containing protein n=1 Tax=Sorangium sp. So ce834 TaxID=3133321 RepID=UPI003F63E84F